MMKPREQMQVLIIDVLSHEHWISISPTLTYIFQIFNMSKPIFALLITLLLLTTCQCRWQFQHSYTAQVSRVISDSIKNKIIANRALFTNQTFANALVNDLNQSNDSSRKLKEIDVNSAAELFALFGMRDYHCDRNRDGVISGDELKCLNNIWKRHVPE